MEFFSTQGFCSLVTLDRRMDSEKERMREQTILPGFSKDLQGQTQPKYITSSYIFSEEDMAKTKAQVRAIGGSLVVTIPKKVVDKEGLHEGEWVSLDVKKVKKDYFGCLPGVGPFTKEDELKGQLD